MEHTEKHNAYWASVETRDATLKKLKHHKLTTSSSPNTGKQWGYSFPSSS